MDRGRRKVVWREGEEAEMLEGSRSLELNINPWWFICCGSLQAPSAHRQLLAPVSWPWTWMWKAGLLPRVPRHELPWLGERQHRPGQVVDLARNSSVCVRVRLCVCDLACYKRNSGVQHPSPGVTTLCHTHSHCWVLRYGDAAGVKGGEWMRRNKQSWRDRAETEWSACRALVYGRNLIFLKYILGVFALIYTAQWRAAKGILSTLYSYSINLCCLWRNSNSAYTRFVTAFALFLIPFPNILRYI